jgi:mannose-6-phosphate isomerase
MNQGFDYPLLLEPIPVPRPWGGDRVRKLYKRCAKVLSDEPIGEWWDVSTWPTDPGNPTLTTVNKIVNGPLAGKLLDQVAEVPVVVKLLDSNEKLSVQVHPVSDDLHKDEMWYILYAEPEAYLFCGFAEGVDPEEFCSLIRAKDPDESQVLSKLECYNCLKAGDYFSVPSGTVHALGPGLVAFEISERTQVTYRLFDYNRGRALHLEEGCASVMGRRTIMEALDPAIDIPDAEQVETISAFPTFCVLKVKGKSITVRSAGRMHLITAIGGDCQITGPTEHWRLTLPEASTCLVPQTQFDYKIVSAGEILISTLRS